MVSLNCAHLCLMHLAPCTALSIIVIIIFAMGGHAKIGLVPFRQPSTCFVAVI